MPPSLARRTEMTIEEIYDEAIHRCRPRSGSAWRRSILTRFRRKASWTLKTPGMSKICGMLPPTASPIRRRVPGGRHCCRPVKWSSSISPVQRGSKCAARCRSIFRHVPLKQAHVIVGLITSEVAGSVGPTDYLLVDWAAGLRQPSLFRCFLVTLPRTAVHQVADGFRFGTAGGPRARPPWLYDQNHRNAGAILTPKPPCCLRNGRPRLLRAGAPAYQGLFITLSRAVMHAVAELVGLVPQDRSACREPTDRRDRLQSLVQARVVRHPPVGSTSTPRSGEPASPKTHQPAGGSSTPTTSRRLAGFMAQLNRAFQTGTSSEHRRWQASSHRSASASSPSRIARFALMHASRSLLCCLGSQQTQGNRGL